MKYFPLSSASFEHQFGIRALTATESIVETTSEYEAEIEMKRMALACSEEAYFAALDDSLASQQEVVHLIIEASRILSSTHNMRRDEPLEIDVNQPLLSIARHVQEDLTILRDDPDHEFPLIAGCVCFPSGWCIAEKIGLGVSAVHAPVPEFASAMGEATQNLLRRLKVNRPVWRTNWGVRPSGQLDQSTRHREALSEAASMVTQKNAGRRCYFRVERQTLARLPKSKNILFAIHTHQSPIEELQRREKQNLLGVIRTCPEQTLRYKGILPMRDALVSFLESHP